MSNEKHLNTILGKWDIPPPSTNLATRIIDAARHKPKYSFWDSLIYEIMATIILPRPAYAMALILFFAIILGLELDILTTDTSEDLFSFANMTEEGGWL